MDHFCKALFSGLHKLTEHYMRVVFGFVKFNISGIYVHAFNLVDFLFFYYYFLGMVFWFHYLIICLFVFLFIYLLHTFPSVILIFSVFTLAFSVRALVSCIRVWYPVFQGFQLSFLFALIFSVFFLLLQF